MICAIFVQPRVGSRQGKTEDYVHYAGIMFVRKATICTSGRLTDSCRELYGLCCFGHPLRCLAIRQTIKLSWLCCVQIGRFRFIRSVVRQAFCREEVCPSVIHFGAILHSCEIQVLNERLAIRSPEFILRLTISEVNGKQHGTYNFRSERKT